MPKLQFQASHLLRTIPLFVVVSLLVAVLGNSGIVVALFAVPCAYIGIVFQREMRSVALAGAVVIVCGAFGAWFGAEVAASYNMIFLFGGIHGAVIILGSLLGSAMWFLFMNPGDDKKLSNSSDYSVPTSEDTKENHMMWFLLRAVGIIFIGSSVGLLFFFLGWLEGIHPLDFWFYFTQYMIIGTIAGLLVAIPYFLVAFFSRIGKNNKN